MFMPHTNKCINVHVCWAAYFFTFCCSRVTLQHSPGSGLWVARGGTNQNQIGLDYILKLILKALICIAMHWHMFMCIVIHKLQPDSILSTIKHQTHSYSLFRSCICLGNAFSSASQHLWCEWALKRHRQQTNTWSSKPLYPLHSNSES